MRKAGRKEWFSERSFLMYLTDVKNFTVFIKCQTPDEVVDEREEDAWQTFLHELLEFRLEETLQVYRMVINGLIEIIEKTCYRKKERFLEQIPEIISRRFLFFRSRSHRHYVVNRRNRCRR